MTVERHLIKNRDAWLELRKQDVTASVAAALWGVHPYQTVFQLWAEKSGLSEPDKEENPAMRRGRLLEPVALQMLKEERPEWSIIAGETYYRDPDTRIGATPDAFADANDGRGVGIVQIKTAGHWAFKKGWRDADTGEVEVPLWIAVQASVEAALTGAKWAAVACMALGDGGLEMFIEEIPIKPALIAKLEELTAEFWRRVHDKKPYAPDWHKDSAAVMSLYADKDGSIIDLTDDEEGAARMRELLVDRKACKDTEAAGAAAAKARKIVDAQIVNRLGNASGARIGSTLVTVKTIKRAGYTVAAGEYQQVGVK